MDRRLSDEEPDPIEDGDLPEQDSYWNLEEESIEDSKGFYEALEDEIDEAIISSSRQRTLDDLYTTDDSEEDEDDER